MKCLNWSTNSIITQNIKPAQYLRQSLQIVGFCWITLWIQTVNKSINALLRSFIFSWVSVYFSQQQPPHPDPALSVFKHRWSFFLFNEGTRTATANWQNKQLNSVTPYWGYAGFYKFLVVRINLFSGYAKHVYYIFLHKFIFA